MALLFATILGILVCTFGASLASPHSHWGSGYHNGGDYYGGGSWQSGSGSGVKPTAAPATTPVESRSMDQLYRSALAEGGKLVIYAGGDAPAQQDSTKNDFERAFPGVKVEMVVDFSKFHGPRIDYQLSTDSVVFDIAQLQTLQDFPRWKKQGVLLNYKPIGWERIYSDFKDADGAYTGVQGSSFSTNVNRNLLPNNATWPYEARDYLRPEFKNKIVLTYPNDDDAVLFWFKMVVDKYGFQYLEDFKKQNPTFVRGTQRAYDLVADGSFIATMSADGGLKDLPGLPRHVLPKSDPFVVWAQQAAIFKKAPHPETAKLYMSWAIDKKVQENGWSFPLRDDVKAPAPFKSIYGYLPNGDPNGLLPFMADREQVEIFKNQIAMVFGEVQGPSPNGILGTHPTQGYPTVDPLNPTA